MIFILLDRFVVINNFVCIWYGLDCGLGCGLDVVLRLYE